MEFIVEKVGMSRTIGLVSTPVTLLRVLPTKVCEVSGDGERAIVAYSATKAKNKAIAGQQKKYAISEEFNKFATISVKGAAVGDLDTAALGEAKVLKVTFTTKGRGYQGVVKRHGFAGGPKSHGSRFHRRHGSIGNCEWPGRVQPGMKMAGHMGNETHTVKNEVVSFDAASGILAVKGSVSGYNGALGRVRIVK